MVTLGPEFLVSGRDLGIRYPVKIAPAGVTSMVDDRVSIRLCMPLIAIVGLVLGLQAGCFFDPSGIAGNEQTPDANPNADAPETPDASPGADAPGPDAPGPDAPGNLCQEWTPVPAHFTPCEIIAPQGGLSLDLPGTYTYDTDSGTLRPPGGGTPIPHASEVLTAPAPDIRLISVDSFALGPDSTLRATGSIPLLIASWSTITVDGTIDVSSGAATGAGANTGACNAAEAGEQADSGGGGGGGAGFGDEGGEGGDGGDGDGSKGTKGAKIDSTPANVRGGCPGGKGGKGDLNDGGGAGGNGGGALQLTARQAITINGKLHAGGQGGRPANADSGGSGRSRRSGGGGGGSGGMLGLEAPMIAVGASAILAANGGGGGGGCSTELANAGEDGKLDNIKANKGGGQGEGGDGGDGGFVTSVKGQVASNGGEGGGGGGGGAGVGYIIMSRMPTVTSGAKISPAYVTR
jgi:hypothetical protein